MGVTVKKKMQHNGRGEYAIILAEEKGIYLCEGKISPGGEKLRKMPPMGDTEAYITSFLPGEIGKNSKGKKP